jgi:hypothetical protein
MFRCIDLEHGCFCLHVGLPEEEEEIKHNSLNEGSQEN